MSKYPPTLEIPVSESARNLQEVTVTLLFDTPKEFEGKYGLQYKYSVEVDGTEHTLFASAALHRKIQEQYPVKGSQLSIARFGTGKETKWDVVMAGGPKGAPQKPGTASAAPVQGSGPRGTPQAFVEALNLYWDAFDHATAAITNRGLQANVDINAVAFVIYKLAQDNNVTNIQNPLEAAPTTTDAAETAGKNKMLAEIISGFQRTNLEEDLYLTAINMHNEGQPYEAVEEMTREVGVAVWASIKNVEAGTTTWADIILPVEAPF